MKNNINFDIELLKNIAKLSRIRIPEEQIEYYRDKMSSCLHWFDALSELDVSNVEPMSSVLSVELQIREDKPKPTIREDILANAPLSKYNYFVVPKVIDGKD